MKKNCRICGVSFLPVIGTMKFCIDCKFLNTTPVRTIGDILKNRKVKGRLKIRPSEGIDLVRDRVRDRDNNQCRMCGKEWVKGMRKFDVHHLDIRMESVKNYMYDKTNTELLITFCHRCHLRSHYLIKKSLVIMGIELQGL